jgi:putative oxidoreductase
MVSQIRQDLFKSHVHAASLLLRIGLAAIFIAHGYLKLAQGGGQKWSDDLTEETQLAVALGETICGIALLFGFLSRLAALGLIVIMVGAIVFETGRYDFINLVYEKSNPGRARVGAEYNFALIIMSMAVIALGAGAVSIDYLLFGRKKTTAAG